MKNLITILLTIISLNTVALPKLNSYPNASATIFLDFDRTIASTKCGADPLVGCHSIDASLLGVMNAHR